MVKIRNVTFRGKSAVSGKWVYGDLSSKNKNYLIYINDERHGVHEKVIPATIGQELDIRDSYAQIIYEGDIVRIERFTWGELSLPFVVEWDEGFSRFTLRAADTNGETIISIPFCDLGALSFEKIGNIHDNPNRARMSRDGRKRNCDVFREIFGIYATEMWMMTDEEFVTWYKAEYKGKGGC